LLSYSLSPGGVLRHQQTLHLSANILDVAQMSGQPLVVLSLDTVHKPWSAKVLLDDASSAPAPFVALRLVGPKQGSQWQVDDYATSINAGFREVMDVPVVAKEDGQGHRSKGDYSVLGEFLYGLENLRKRRGMAVDEVEEDEVVAEEQEVLVAQ
jgi:hypothetical protein